MDEKKLKRIKNIKGLGNNSIIALRSIFGINLKKQSKFNIPYISTLRIKKFLRIKKTDILLQTLIKKRINNHILIKSYIGIRHKNSYPVRGQRTHTNAKTQKKLAFKR